MANCCHNDMFISEGQILSSDIGFRMSQRSKALQLSGSCVTTDPGSIPGCITTGCDW